MLVVVDCDNTSGFTGFYQGGQLTDRSGVRANARLARYRLGMTGDDLRRVIEDVAAEALREKRAYLHSDEHGMQLEPSDASACSVAFGIQSDNEVSLFVGRYETAVDIYDRDPVSLREKVEEFVSAVLNGRYEEEVRLTSEAGQDVLGKARGVFYLHGGAHRVGYSYVPSLGRRGPWQRITYSPY